MTVEDRLRQAMADETALVPPPPDRWEEVAARASARRGKVRRRSRRKAGSLTLLGLAAAAAAALIALPALTHYRTRQVVVTPGGQPTTVTAPVPTTAPPAAAATVPPNGASQAVPSPGYQPLYPFRDIDEANAWQASSKGTGSQPWHLDPGQTALSFTGFLGYRDVTTVFGVRNDATGAHVTVGFSNPNARPAAAAVIHLRRFGTGSGAPWEVVGTDDTPNFSLTTPRYGAVVSSPFAAGGAIKGVDENIKVQVLQLSSAVPVGGFCCRPAGNSGAPWAADVSFHGATDKVLIVSASTGGHLASVERFTVTAVRTSGGATPGL